MRHRGKIAERENVPLTNFQRISGALKILTKPIKAVIISVEIPTLYVGEKERPEGTC
jgi:hypothetical protein